MEKRGKIKVYLIIFIFPILFILILQQGTILLSTKNVISESNLPYIKSFVVGGGGAAKTSTLQESGKDLQRVMP